MSDFEWDDSKNRSNIENHGIRFEDMKKQYTKPLTTEELAAMQEEDINTDDIPELGDDFWKNAKVRYPKGEERRDKQRVLRCMYRYEGKT